MLNINVLLMVVLVGTTSAGYIQVDQRPVLRRGFPGESEYCNIFPEKGYPLPLCFLNQNCAPLILMCPHDVFPIFRLRGHGNIAIVKLRLACNQISVGIPGSYI